MIILIQFLWADGFAFWPFILVRSKTHSARLIRHERTHLRQQVELFIFFFYAWYVLEFALRLLQFRDLAKAYRNISFEREAYQNETNTEYLTRRKSYSFLAYL